MVEKLYLGLTLLFFILAFALKNISTYLATRKSIRGKSGKLTLSITLSTLIYLLIGLRILFLQPEWLLELSAPPLAFRYIGYVLIAVGFLIGLLSLITMKDSWRVGIKHEQKTALITTGIYRISRNPYFFSYDILILGYLLVYPSPILLLLYLPLVATFHLMILAEEKYLIKVHGDDYRAYQQRVGRYLGWR